MTETTETQLSVNNDGNSTHVEQFSDVAQMSIEARSNRSLLRIDKARTPIKIKWKHLYYTVKVKDPTSTQKCNAPKIDKIILDNISGEALPGQLIAIMGPSGSGKTTLLNCLAKRINQQKGSILEGKITLNGVDREELGSKFARIAAFVQQDDVLFNMQTVTETLITAAKLRLSKVISFKEKQDRVDAIIQELGLMKAKNTRIGDARIRGVSGGERKRCNIGVELIQDPSVLFLDEPTSGLDSFQALNVVETLKILCSAGCTIVLSIHQPRSSIFALFDQLILLAEGKLIYSGKAGDIAVNYFSKLGFKCPKLFNPADYFLDIVSIDNRSNIEEEKSKKRIEFLIKSFNKYNLDNDKNNNGNNNKDDESSDVLSLEKFVPKKTVTSSYYIQLQVLGERSVRQLLRDKFSLSIRLFMTLFFGLFIAALYSETGIDQKSIQDRQGILFFITINQSFGPLINTINTFTLEKTIVMRERQAKSYHLSSYYLTKFLVSLPVEAIFPCIFGSIVYWIVNLKKDLISFLFFLLINIITSFVSISMGFFVGSMAPNPDAANAIAPIFMIISILFGGFYINSDNIPIWISWVQELSHIRWSFMAFAINEFTDRNFQCDSQYGDDACYSTGNEVLQLLSFDKWSIWEPIRNMLLLFIAYHTMAYLLLRFKKQRYMEVSPINYSNQKAKQYNVDIRASESKQTLLNSTKQVTNELNQNKFNVVSDTNTPLPEKNDNDEEEEAKENEENEENDDDNNENEVDNKDINVEVDVPTEQQNKDYMD